MTEKYNALIAELITLSELINKEAHAGNVDKFSGVVQFNPTEKR